MSACGAALARLTFATANDDAGWFESLQEYLTLSSTPLVGSKPRATKTPPRRPTASKIADRTLYDLAEIFKMLSDESRLKILLTLAYDGEQHVSALCELLHPQSQPTVSHHLTLLRKTGLVRLRRDGKHNIYRIDSSFVVEVLEQFFADCGNGHRSIQFDDFSLAFKRR
jgi:ArsR family transcriptional regulator